MFLYNVITMPPSPPLTALTVRDLVADATLGTRVVAGSGGLDRAVLWAHASEIPEPDRWLGPHELLMTVGLCVPSGSAAQRQFISRLADAGLAGVAIGEDGIAPRLTKAMLAEADARGFPVLATGGDVPFAAIGRTVAAANADRQTMSVLQLARLYQAVARQDTDGRRSGRYLRDLFGADLTVVDEATGCVVIGPGTIRFDASRSAAPSIAPLSSRSRSTALRSTSLRSTSLRSSPPTRLLIAGEVALDSLTLAHLTQVLAVEATAILQAASDQIGGWTHRLDGVLAGRIEAVRAARHHLGDIAADADALQVVAVPLGVPDQVALAVALAGIPILGLSVRRDTVVIAAPSAQIARLRELLAELGHPAGGSAPHTRLEDLPSAVEQATEELQRAQAEGSAWREYRGAPLTLLTRSDSEARHAIASVLRGLADPDPRATALRETLFCLLDHDLRWGATADALGIHRQTLVHRMHRVEETTGRSVRSTAHVSELWLARTAWRRLEFVEGSAS